MKKIIVLFILCIFFATLIFFIFREKQPSSRVVETSSKTTLPTHILKNSSFTYTQNFIGSIEAIQSVAVVPYLSAFLKEIYVHSGEEVKKGETLFLLDQKIPLADLNQAKEAVKQALAKQENAKSYYERIQKTDKKAISLTELEQAKTEYEAAKAAYQKALAAQNQAQTLYNYTIIQAPISGWLGDITATIGEYLSPESKPLATIIGFSPIRVVFAIPLSTYKGDYFFNNPSLEIVLSDKHVLEFKNFKISHDNKADKSTDSLSFFIDIPNDKKLLIPGAYVQVRFLYSENGILVNKNWITLTPEGAEAFLIKNGIVEKQKVEIGASINTQYWIKAGLNEGENIITVPISPFQIGQPAEGIEQ